MPQIVNMTPHDIHAQSSNGDWLIFPASGRAVRVAQESRLETQIRGIPVAVPTFGSVRDLPNEEPDTFLIVSMMVRTAAPSRRDLLSPGDLVRDAEGKTIGCMSFQRNPITEVSTPK